MHISSLAIPGLLLLAACASAPEKKVEAVRIVTREKAGECKSLGEFTVYERGGQDKQGGALQRALDEVSNRGGNGLLIVSHSSDWMDGAALTGQGLQCKF